MIRQFRERTPRGGAGFALVEVALSLTIFAIATSILAHTYRAGHGLRTQAHEEGLASSAAQDVLERMRGAAFDRIVPLFDANPFNDPLGPGIAHGAVFDVPGLEPDPADPDGRVGEVVLPLVDVGTAVVPAFQVREDQGPPELGLPRDLDGDAIVDDEDHSADAILLPVVVRIRWKGRNGARVLEFYSALTEYVE